MFNISRLFFRPQRRSVEAQFIRFLQLNYRVYADLCVFGAISRSTLVSPAVSKACREWLPSLPNKTHRDICESIADLHDASAKREASLDALMTALDQLASTSPTQYAEIVSPSKTLDSTAIKRPPTLAQTTPPAKPASVENLGDDVTCHYCGIAPGQQTQFLSGEPVAVCNAMACLAEHDELLCGEVMEFSRAGLIGGIYH